MKLQKDSERRFEKRAPCRTATLICLASVYIFQPCEHFFNKLNDFSISLSNVETTTKRLDSIASSNVCSIRPSEKEG